MNDPILKEIYLATDAYSVSGTPWYAYWIGEVTQPSDNCRLTIGRLTARANGSQWVAKIHKHPGGAFGDFF